MAARATILSSYLRSYESALVTSQIWAEEDPHNIDAHRYAADQFRIDGDLKSAIFHMETIKQLGGLANFELVAFQAENLDQAGRNILLSTISEMLKTDLCSKFRGASFMVFQLCINKCKNQWDFAAGGDTGLPL